MPGVQILPLSQPEHAIPRQSRMLPQDVRILRRPYLLFRTRTVPCRRLCAYATKAALSETDFRGYQGREGSRHQKKGCRRVSPGFPSLSNREQLRIAN